MLAANFETTSDLMTFEKMPLIKPDSGVTLSEKMFCRVICSLPLCLLVILSRITLQIWQKKMK